MRLLKAGINLLVFSAFILLPGTASSEEILLVRLYTPEVCSQSAAYDFKPIVQPDLSVPEGVPSVGTTPALLSDEEMESVPAKGVPPGGTTPALLSDEELDNVSAEGLSVTSKKTESGEAAIILWDEAMGTVTTPEGYGEVHVERR